MQNIKELFVKFPHAGKVEWVSFRPEKRGEVKITDVIFVSPENGIEGDHYSGKNRKRQVTLIQSEHIETIAKLLKKGKIDPTLLRRNIVVSGINLLALNDAEFTIGTARLKMTGLCHPCSRMEQNLGEGGYNAMRGHGGITCEVIEAGKIKMGGDVRFEKLKID
jgi:MOSC domain-containing protein YiiM